MGLPSGVQWANCNVGAEDPSDLGLYFSWGNVEGHQRGEDYNFSQSNYNNSPAAAIADDLSLDQDAARAVLGDPWRMPTDVEIQELVSNCTYMWTSLNGVDGCLFTSNVNGNTLFFPAAGYYNGRILEGHRSYGYYWSSKFDSVTLAGRLVFNSSNAYPQGVSNRHYGFTVRAVLQTT